MSNYLAFDLQTALRHPHRVVTRDGRKVSEIFHAKTVDDEAGRVLAVIGGDSYPFYENGQYFPDQPAPLDLFLLPETRDVWVNLYPSSIHETKEDADRFALVGRIACVKVTIEMPPKKGGAE